VKIEPIKLNCSKLN